MPNGYILINGDQFNIMGEITEQPLAHDTTVETDRAGNTYPTSTSRTRTVTVENIKMQPGEYQAYIDFLNSCDARNDGFVVTVVMDDECNAGDGQRIDFFGCLITGSPQIEMFARRITGFSFSYEERRVQGNDTTSTFGRAAAA